jgi:hypothetical protein
MGYLVGYIGLDSEVTAKLIQKMELLYLEDDVDAVVGKFMNFFIFCLKIEKLAIRTP